MDSPLDSFLSSIQLDLFDAPLLVKTVDTNLGRFGNRTDVIVVTARHMGGASLLEPALGVVHVDGQGLISGESLWPIKE